MNKLIIARHGSYDTRNLRLNELGRKQILALSEKLENHVNGEPVIILSSTADRAIESAEILSEELGIEMESHDILWSDLYRDEDYEGTYSLIKEKGDGVGVMIIVTHLEYTQALPRFFSRKEFGEDGDNSLYGRNFLDKGQACVIDCKKREMFQIR